MNDKNLDLAIRICAALMNGEDIQAAKNQTLYNAYNFESEVFDITNKFMDGLGLTIYEYQEGLYVSCGIANKRFGYTNEDLRKAMNFSKNEELFTAYFLMYVIILQFYSDSSTTTYKTYIKPDMIITAMDELLRKVTDEISILTKDEIKQNSLKRIALLWDGIPTFYNNSQEDSERMNKNSKSGYVRTVLRFLHKESLFTVDENRYFPTNRFHALAKHYFQDNGSEIHAILNSDIRRDEDATY